MKNKAKVFKWIKWAFTAFILFFLVVAVLSLDAAELFDALRQIPIWAIVVLFITQIFTKLIINYQWFTIARSFGSLITYLRTIFLNSKAEIMLAAPTGQIGCDVFRAVSFSKEGNLPATSGAAVVAVQKIFTLSAFFIISLISAVFFVRQVPVLQQPSIQVILYVVIGLALTFFGAIFIFPHRLRDKFSKDPNKQSRFKALRSVQGFFAESLEHIYLIRKNKKLMIKLVILAIVIWLLYPLKMYLLAVQLLPGVNMIYIFAAVYLAYTVSLIPIFPAGIGGFEPTLIVLLMIIGISDSGAVVLTVIFRFATFWFMVISSLIFIPIYRIFNPKSKDIVVSEDDFEEATAHN